MRTFKIYSLSNFQIYSRVLVTIVTMLYVTSPVLIYSYNWKFFPFDHLHPFPLTTRLPESLGNINLFCFYGCSVLRFHIQYLSLSVWLNSFSIMPSKSIHVVTNSRISFFLWLLNISLSVCGVCIIFSLSICPLMNT